MKRIDYGAATANFDLDGDGIVNASIGGLLLSANAGALSALLLRGGADHGSPGVLRSVPVAVVVSAEQFGVCKHVAQAAAASGAIRRAFLSRDQARAWLREQVRALKANQVWRTAHR